MFAWTTFSFKVNMMSSRYGSNSAYLPFKLTLASIVNNLILKKLKIEHF
jgi:hypothetical protein